MRQEVYSMLDDMAEGIVRLLPKIGLAFIIIVAGFLLGKLFQNLTRRLINFLDGRLNQLLKNTSTNVDLRSSARFISLTVFWIILVISLMIGLQVLELDFLRTWIDRLVGYLPNILAAVVIVFAGIILGRLLGDIIRSAASRTGLVSGTYLGRLAKYLVLFVSIMIAVGQVGIDIVFLREIIDIILAALLFGAALAFGLGAKNSVQNILGAYYFKKSYKKGDRIRVSEVEGNIVRITDHSVTLETKSGITTIPAREFNRSNVTLIRENE